ncbi:MAG: MATE family efflux transporter [Planctomycetota bacterium]|nr:MATE family efflux transporter [Planctomycetota bacterium]MDP7130366.1 MATE family efflux transporter [Planctomycetota bacterium]MDP7249008.1 MATE family efflux transporter [Planctomycetota bacterium]
MNEAPASSQILHGNLRKTLFILALPVLGEQLLNSFVGLYDTYLAGKISKDATAAIGLAAYVGWLASMLFSLVGTGTTALVSRFWGAGENEQANKVANRSIALAALIGVILYGLMYAFAPMLARLQNMHDETYDIAVRYLRIDAVGYMFTSLTLIGSAALRGAGDMRTPMLLLAVVNALNVVVSSTLVFGLGPFEPWGVDGIVAGTVTARVTGGILMLVLLSVGVHGLKLYLSELKVRGELVWRVLRIGLPTSAEGAILWSGHFVFLMIIARLFDGDQGKAAYAAHIIAVRVEAFSYLPAVAWGTAAATMIGQSLGANMKDRARMVGHEGALQCGISSILFGLIFYFEARWIFDLMHKEKIVGDVGVPAMQLLAFFQPPLVLSIVYGACLRGAGDTRWPLFFTIIGALFIRIPLAYIFGIHLEGGLVGAWVGMCGDMTLRAFLNGYRYTRGKWVETRV